MLDVSRAAAGLLLLVIAMPGCDSGSHVNAPIETAVETAKLQAITIGEANAAIDDRGRFRVQRESSDRSEISSATALSIARTYMRQFGPFNASRYFKVVGWRFNISELVADDRVYFAASPYEMPPEGTPAFLRRAIGPFYLFTFRVNGTPVISLAVSARNNDIQIIDEDHLLLPQENGGGFVSEGIQNRMIPMSPEEAALRVATAFDTKIRTVPRLYRDAVPGFVPNYGFWAVKLATPQVVKTIGATSKVTTDEIFIDYSGQFYVADRTDDVMSLRTGRSATGNATVNVAVSPDGFTSLKEVGK